MKIENQLNFKSAHFSRTADRALCKRLAAGEFVKYKTDFLNKYKDSKLDINISTVNEESNRLLAVISINNRQVNMVQESRLTKFLYTPVHFIEKLSKEIEILESRFFNKQK